MLFLEGREFVWLYLGNGRSFFICFQIRKEFVPCVCVVVFWASGEVCSFLFRKGRSLCGCFWEEKKFVLFFQERRTLFFVCFLEGILFLGIGNVCLFLCRKEKNLCVCFLEKEGACIFCLFALLLNLHSQRKSKSKNVLICNISNKLRIFCSNEGLKITFKYLSFSCMLRISNVLFLKKIFGQQTSSQVVHMHRKI